MKTSAFRGGRALVLMMLALVAALPMPALAASGNYGRLAGYVYDPTGAALAEVPLTVSGPALQQPQSRTSGEDGRFEFDTLPPGEGYVLEVNVPGFAPIKKTGIIVLLGQSTQVDVKLEVFTETQAVATYEIVEKVNPIINPDSAQTGAVMNAEKAATTPVFTQVQAMPQLVAGVGTGNSPSLRAGLSRYGKFYVDGMDTTDVVDGSITAPMSFYAVENFEVITGGLDAQYNSLGLIENVVSKSGSNKFTYDVTMILSPAWANAKYRGASNQNPSVSGYTQNEVPLSETSFYSPLVGVGGPIIKDKLWFYFSGQWNFSHRETPLGEENRPTDTETRLARLKLTWQPTAKDRLSVAFNYDNNAITNQVAQTSASPEAETQIDRGGFFAIANYDHSFTDNVLFQLQTGATYKDIWQGPMNEDSQDIAHIYNSTTYRNAGALRNEVGNLVTEERLRFQFDPTLLFKVKNHQMKAGVQVSYLSGSKTAQVIGNQRYIDRNGECNPDDPATFQYCNQRIDFYNSDGVQAPLTTEAANLIAGAFLQDRWNVNRHLTLVGGIRADVGRLYGDNNQFITNLVGVGPRFSATYDLFGNRGTLLKAHYGRSNEVGDVFIAQHANPGLTQVTSTFSNGAFADCAPDTTGNTLCSVSGGPTGRSFEKGHTPPHVDELALGLHHAIAEQSVIGLDLTYRKYSNLWVDEEMNRIWDPSGQRVIGYADGVNHTVVKIHNPDDAWRDYKGMDLWVQGRNGPWDLLASYTLAFSEGTVGDYFDGYGFNPRFKRFFEGPSPEDIRHTLKGSIGYTTRFGLDFGVRFNYRTGAPMWMYQEGAVDRQRVVRSPRGTGHANNTNTGTPDFNDPSLVSELRQPSQFLLDAQARYDLNRLVKMGETKMELTLIMFNVLNNSDVTFVQEQYRATNNRFGTATSRRNPMQAELLLRVRN
ncbi:TonB-dependent receptor [Myxococcus sp. RHSTA-1-4]|uniref:TonB-dependent receptor n=1 Tax=Myxococcus sp. RHSTA-1-4 TaxID=2874601 RepID=UPI001CBF609F|nr:TonB-dependent receptor [Myxococcus sp. RHSTA-1-4]MBZ4421689.1 TonB-dependent receptor [Myxococcus sp. RHSTA-1-4]